MRHVYFSFHYQDVLKANQVRNNYVVGGAKSAGFADKSLWEEAKAKSKAALERLIASGLEGTSVTAVLIGTETASRPWVKYEIQESINRGNALIGIHINKIPQPRGPKSTRKGAVPALLKKHQAPIYSWTNAQQFGEWVEAAFTKKNPEPGFFAWLGRVFD